MHSQPLAALTATDFPCNPCPLQQAVKCHEKPTPKRILFKDLQCGKTYPSFHAPLTGPQIKDILWQLEFRDGTGKGASRQLTPEDHCPGGSWLCANAAICLW